MNTLKWKIFDLLSFSKDFLQPINYYLIDALYIIDLYYMKWPAI